MIEDTEIEFLTVVHALVSDSEKVVQAIHSQISNTSANELKVKTETLHTMAALLKLQSHLIKELLEQNPHFKENVIQIVGDAKKRSEE